MTDQTDAFLSAAERLLREYQIHDYEGGAKVTERDIAWFIAQHAPAASAPAAVDVDKLVDIRHGLATQDNRATAHPLFAVQQRRRIYGIDESRTDTHCWIDDEGNEVEPHDAPGDERVGYIDTWEFVTACLTERGCLDYIKANGHNLTDPRVYVYSAYRNAEWQTLRAALARKEESRGW